MKTRSKLIALAGAALLAGACANGAPEEHAAAPQRQAPAGTVFVVRDTTLSATIEAAGVAEPIAQATLSTKLMGSVLQVLVQEGDRVAVGQPLVRIDARDLEAKSAQVEAGIAEADAVYRDAQTQAARIRALYADSAATRAQLDQAETGLARAQAAVRQVSAARAEVGAIRGYSVIRAPFAGVVTQRFVDPGAFAAPGAPLLTVQNGSRLRLSASAAPRAVAGLRVGQAIAASIEGQPVTATVEGIVPAPGAALYTINALVDNADGRHLPGGAATLALPQGERRGLLVPLAALQRDGDLAGVYLQGPGAPELRWVRLGGGAGDYVEVTSGLQAGDRILVPTASGGTTALGGD